MMAATESQQIKNLEFKANNEIETMPNFSNHSYQSTQLM